MNTHTNRKHTHKQTLLLIPQQYIITTKTTMNTSQ